MAFVGREPGRLDFFQAQVELVEAVGSSSLAFPCSPLLVGEAAAFVGKWDLRIEALRSPSLDLGNSHSSAHKAAAYTVPDLHPSDQGTRARTAQTFPWQSLRLAISLVHRKAGMVVLGATEVDWARMWVAAVEKVVVRSQHSRQTHLDLLSAYVEPDPKADQKAGPLRSRMTVVKTARLASVAADLAFCARRPHKNPRNVKPRVVLRTNLRTSFPLCVHRWQGRALSHRRCFFLQLTHADAT